MVLVRLKREHEIVRDGRRVMVPAGQTVEVSRHQYDTFRDRMEIVPAAEPKPKTTEPGATEPEPEPYTVEPRAGGWYAIVVNGEEKAKARKADIPAKLAELGLEG